MNDSRKEGLTFPKRNPQRLLMGVADRKILSFWSLADSNIWEYTVWWVCIFNRSFLPWDIRICEIDDGSQILCNEFVCGKIGSKGSIACGTLATFHCLFIRPAPNVSAQPSAVAIQFTKSVDRLYTLRFWKYEVTSCIPSLGIPT